MQQKHLLIVADSVVSCGLPPSVWDSRFRKAVERLVCAFLLCLGHVVQLFEKVCVTGKDNTPHVSLPLQFQRCIAMLTCLKTREFKGDHRLRDSRYRSFVWCKKCQMWRFTMPCNPHLLGTNRTGELLCGAKASTLATLTHTKHCTNWVGRAENWE